MKKVLLGLTGSIACYKSAYLCRHLVERGCDVQVAMTANANRFISTLTMQALSKKSVFLEEWDAPVTADGMDHIAAARHAQVFIVAPASANFIAKAANGMADNLLLSAFLATNAPRYIAPAMNYHMWIAKETQANIAKLQDNGVTVLMPDVGEQACGDYGAGRMQEPEIMAEQIIGVKNKTFWGKKVVISTGATFSAIDPMRIITNRSSGKMGFCLAQAVKAAGGYPVVVAGLTQAPPPPAIPVITALSNDEMEKAVLQQTEQSDWFFAVAAVADYQVKNSSTEKLEREKATVDLQLEPTKDILQTVVAQRPHLKCLGFAAQQDMAQDKAKIKMEKKGVAFLAVNHCQEAGQADTQLYLLHRNGRTDFIRQSKEKTAEQIIATIDDVSHETGETT